MRRSMIEAVGRAVEIAETQDWVDRSVILINRMIGSVPARPRGPDLRIGLERERNHLFDRQSLPGSSLAGQRRDQDNQGDDRVCYRTSHLSGPTCLLSSFFKKSTWPKRRR